MFLNYASSKILCSVSLVSHSGQRELGKLFDNRLNKFCYDFRCCLFLSILARSLHRPPSPHGNEALSVRHARKTEGRTQLADARTQSRVSPAAGLTGSEQPPLSPGGDAAPFTGWCSLSFPGLLKLPPGQRDRCKETDRGRSPGERSVKSQGWFNYMPDGVPACPPHPRYSLHGLEDHSRLRRSDSAWSRLKRWAENTTPPHGPCAPGSECGARMAHRKVKFPGAIPAPSHPCLGLTCLGLGASREEGTSSARSGKPALQERGMYSD